MIRGTWNQFSANWSRLCLTDPYAFRMSSQLTTICRCSALASRSDSNIMKECSKQPGVSTLNPLNSWDVVIAFHEFLKTPTNNWQENLRDSVCESYGTKFTRICEFGGFRKQFDESDGPINRKISWSPNFLNNFVDNDKYTRTSLKKNIGNAIQTWSGTVSFLPRTGSQFSEGWTSFRK